MVAGYREVPRRWRSPQGEGARSSPLSLERYCGEQLENPPEVSTGAVWEGLPKDGASLQPYPREGAGGISTLTSPSSLPLQSPPSVSWGLNPSQSQRYEIHRGQRPWAQSRVNKGREPIRRAAKTWLEEHLHLMILLHKQAPSISSVPGYCETAYSDNKA